MMMVKIKNHHKGCQPHHDRVKKEKKKKTGNQHFVCFVVLNPFSNKYVLTIFSYQHGELQSDTERR